MRVWLSTQLWLLSACLTVLVRAPTCWGPVLSLFQILWARPQPHTGGASGTLVLQPAGQQQQQWHQQTGAEAFQALRKEESQAQEMCPTFHWLLWPQQGQVNLTSGAEGMLGSQQGRRWVPFLPRCMRIKDWHGVTANSGICFLPGDSKVPQFEKMSGINTLPCKCSSLFVLWLFYPLLWAFVLSTI